MNILILGANGLIGRNLVKYALSRNYNVFALINKRSDFIPPNCKIIEWHDIEGRKLDFHLVFVSTGNFSLSVEELIKVNVETVLKCVKYFNKSRIVFISSVEVYGKHEDVIDEMSSYNNPNNYGLSKLAGEFIIKSHTNYAIIRLGVVYGYGISSNTFLFKAIEDAIKHGMIKIFGDGTRKQDYIYIDDAIQICFKAGLYNKCETFLGVSGISYSNTEVANIIKKLTGATIIYTGIDNANSWEFDNSISQKKLDLIVNYSFEEGIKEYIKNTYSVDCDIQ